MNNTMYIFYNFRKPNNGKGRKPRKDAIRGEEVLFLSKRDELKSSPNIWLREGIEKRVVKEQIRKAKSKSMGEALTPRHRTDNKRIPMVVTYHPGLPNINWRNPDCSFPEADESSGLSRSLKTETATTRK